MEALRAEWQNSTLRFASTPEWKKENKKKIKTLVVLIKGFNSYFSNYNKEKF